MKNETASKPGKARLSRLWWYLLLIVILSAFCYVTLHMWLLPYSVEYSETGKMTAGYFLYAAIGLLFSTPTPLVAVLIMALFIEKTGIRQMFRNIFRTENKLKTILITGGFCLLALVYAILFGTPNGSPWYMFPLGFVIMIPFVGIAEETGWRGLLQPELDKRMPYPFSVLLTAAIWFVWHFPVFLDPTSNHSGDSIIGFGITIFIWAFALAAIYKSTKSVIACALYHAFMDAIGAVYDWNALFDRFPGSISTNVFRGIWLIAAVVLWFVSEKNDKQGQNPQFHEMSGVPDQAETVSGN
ncbi:MAG: CPBP family intramembrane metalloprotease [Oscillospiraceae bacterium]|nr:CPBP family intramembrane metalloprotease [Oscillospiraceae bacterium]